MEPKKENNQNVNILKDEGPMPDNWIDIVNAGLEERWKHASRISFLETGETVEIFPNGKILVITDKDGNKINEIVGYIEPGYEEIYGYGKKA